MKNKIYIKWSTLLLSLSFSSLDSDLFIIFFKGSQILSSLWELSFLHTLSDIPMDKGSLGIHKIEFMIKSAEDFSDSCGIWDHAACSHNFSKITSRDNSWWLIVNSDFESSWAPVNELNGSLGFNGGNSSIDVFWNNISSVHHWASHIFTMSWVAFGHHVGWLEAAVGDFSNW